MATTAKLDQLVKGYAFLSQPLLQSAHRCYRAPPPNVSPTRIAEAARAASPPLTSDPLSNLPSSPPQIYLNLLILESSLRLQHLSLWERLRLHSLLFFLLSLWCATFTYLLFFRPREDGSGVGGSVYWVIESIEKLGFCGGVVTLCLFWGTGMYERGVRWPRKFVGTTNRGLRGFNLKVVVIRGSLLSELGSWLSLLDPLCWFRDSRINFQTVPKDIEAHGLSLATPASLGKDHWNIHASRHGLVEEDIAPSGDVLKLLLLPKPFSPDFREGWETYRTEYWERENARRASLRQIVRARRREVAKSEGGWLWWTGWRGWQSVSILGSKSRRQLDLEKLALQHDKPSSERVKERRRREALIRGESHSRSSSRGSTSTPEPLEATTGKHARERVRRGSSAGGSTGRRPLRKKEGAGSRLSATETVLEGTPRPIMALTSRSSNLSTSSTGSEEAKKEEAAAPEIKLESEEA